MSSDLDVRLMQKVKNVAGVYLEQFSPVTSVPIQFWAGLTSNESGVSFWRGLDPKDFLYRFEPNVYYGLVAVQKGTKPRYGNITTIDLAMKSPQEIHDLACSWGFTQVMGYHTLHHGSLEQLKDPTTHYPIAGYVMSEFIQAYDLDPSKDFEAMGRCWNSGRPDGTTYDAEYIPNLLRRMGIWESLGNITIKAPTQNSQGE